MKKKQRNNFSCQGKTIRVFSDGGIELSDGIYDLSFNNLEKAVKEARKRRDALNKHQRGKA